MLTLVEDLGLVVQMGRTYRIVMKLRTTFPFGAESIASKMAYVQVSGDD